MTRLQIQLAKDDAQGVADLATRLQVPAAAAARLLLRAGLDAARTNPAAILGAAWGGSTRSPATAPAA